METTSIINIPISTDVFIRLVDFLRQQGSSRDPVETIHDAIDYWMDNASWKQEDLLPDIFDKEKGYQWKEVFLPHKTLARKKHKGELFYAKVEGDQFIYNGKRSSPSHFVNSVNGIGKGGNAWRELEIKRPGDSSWQPANVLRHHFTKNGSPNELDFENEPSHQDGKYILTILEEDVAADSLPDLLIRSLEMLNKRFPSLLSSLEKKGKRGKRPYVTKNKDSVYPGRKDLLQSHPPRSLEGGYFIGTNIGKKEMLNTIQAACDIAGITYGFDVALKK